MIARTDALAIEGVDAAIERGQAYAEAGADVIFVEAPTTEAEIEAVGRRLRHPLLINMFQGGKTPLVALDRLARWGYRIVIIPSDLQRASIRAMEDVLAAIKRDGNSAALIDRMATSRSARPSSTPPASSPSTAASPATDRATLPRPTGYPDRQEGHAEPGGSGAGGGPGPPGTEWGIEGAGRPRLRPRPPAQTRRARRPS